VRGPTTSLTELLLELQTLDRVPRSGYVLRGVPDAESVSEHCFQLAMTVWLLAAEEPQVDRARAVELALVHDLAEARIGDLPRTAAGYFAPGAKHEAERRAVEHLLAPADAGCLDRYREYEGQATAEARFVKECDRLQLLLKTTVYERWGARGLDEIVARSAALADSEFASVRRRYAELELARAGGAGSGPRPGA